MGTQPVEGGNGAALGAAAQEVLDLSIDDPPRRPGPGLAVGAPPGVRASLIGVDEDTTAAPT